MKLPATLLAAACALALSACGDDSRDSATTATPPPAATAPTGDTAGADPASGPEAPGTQVPADATTPPAGDTAAAGTAAGETGTTGTGPAATDASSSGAAGQAAVEGCTANVEGNDRMQYNVSSIVVPASCSEFTIKLTHTGQLPEAAMGHNVVITAASDMAAVSADGISAGAGAGYVKSGDNRIVAATDMIGGGESTSVTFDVAKIKSGGPYQFFCSFPGHAALMKGTISVG